MLKIVRFPEVNGLCFVYTYSQGVVNKCVKVRNWRLNGDFLKTWGGLVRNVGTCQKTLIGEIYPISASAALANPRILVDGAGHPIAVSCPPCPSPYPPIPTPPVLPRLRFDGA